jgi:DNA topoisomerase III
LYEAKLVSYPRTDSRYLSDDLYPECRKILEALKVDSLDLNNLRKDKFIFNNNKITDHHAVIPTGELGTLSGNKENIYNAIVTRFKIVFHADCIKANTVISSKVDDFEFTAKGTVIKEQGWRALAVKSKDITLPNFTEGEHGMQEATLEEGKTKPAILYTEDTLLGAMETCGKDIEDAEIRKNLNSSGIGTPATRAEIIQTLIKREYISIDDNKISPSPKGKALIECIKDESIKSPELTGEWEMMLKNIEDGSLSSVEFLNKIKAFTTKIVETVKSDENKQDNPIIKLAAASSIGKCPKCETLVLSFPKTYSCSGKECDFVIWKTILGKAITPKISKELIQDGKSSLVKGFSKKDKTTKFDAHLFLNDEFKVELKFPERAPLEDVGDCPLCSTKVMASENKVSCETDDCYIVWRNILNKTLTLTDVKDLVSTGSTGVIKGFKGKGKKFSAKMIYNQELKKTEMTFLKSKKH